MDFFDEAVQEVLNIEGVWSNVAGDRGGRTKYGITERTFKKSLADGTISGVGNISELTIEQAKTILRAKYWFAINLEKINNQKIATEIFDSSVNVGPRQAVLIAQLSLDYLGETLTIDSNMGPETIGLLNKWGKKDPQTLFKVLNGFQFVHYACLVDEGLIDILKDRVQGDKKQQKFAAGWMKRIQNYWEG